MVKHLNIKVYGRVQKVFFRKNTYKKAVELNLFGLVRNEPDGTVYIEVEGEVENLEKFISWCNVGPKFARVEKCETTEDSIKNFTDFQIIR